jgi:hypothetical protein
MRWQRPPCYRGVVFRVLVVMATLSCAFEMSGLAAVAGDACSEHCSSDDAGLPCAPNCQLCCCCSLPRTTGSSTGAVALLIPDIRRVTWSTSTGGCPCPDPTAILHVPKIALA